MKKKVFLIVGPERSGTHLAARLINSIANKSAGVDFDSWGGENDCPPLWPVKITHRSLPCGPTPGDGRPAPDGWEKWNLKVKGHGHFVDLKKWGEHHAGWDRTVIVCTRCEEVATLAKMRTFNHTKASALKGQFIAHELLKSWLASRPERIILWSYESLLILGEEYLAAFARSAGLEIPSMPFLQKLDARLVGGNGKYLLPSPPP